ncbi:MAG: photosystem reaction center subunit H [Methylomonas sp.]|nr:MAG: photosystem reaction center subunit H [Methylomonas sp.]
MSIACLNAAYATENPNELIQVDEKQASESEQKSNQLMQQVSRASKIIGTAVKNPNGDKLGEIKDLVLNPDNGQVVYAVVTFGGAMGMGNKLFAIPWQALHWSVDRRNYALNMDKTTLKTAPGFDKKHWPDSSDSWDLQREGLNQFYGVAP